MQNYSHHAYAPLPNKNLLILPSPNFKAKRKVRETVMAVNILIKTPIPKVRAKPLTTLVPIQKRITEVIRLDMFESRMEGHARLKPSVTAAKISLSFFSSSLVLSKIRIFASTAIPIERINPAIPAAVKVTGINLKIESIIRV